MKSHTDNQFYIKMSQSDKSLFHIKHTDKKFHYLRQPKQDRTIKLEYYSSNEMLADLLTKSLPKLPFRKHRNKLLLKFCPLQQTSEGVRRQKNIEVTSIDLCR